MALSSTRFQIEMLTPPQDIAEAMAIRLTVFCEEQGVAPEAEADEWDAIDTHWLVRDETGKAIATARLTNKGNGVGKVERVAVLQEYRAYGIGRLLMEQLEQDAKNMGYTRMVLHAQTQCQGFYERTGYEITDPTVFYEEDIPHVRMEKQLL